MGDVELDVGKLQEELQTLNRERIQLNERLRMHTGGRGPPLGGRHLPGFRDRPPGPRPPQDMRPMPDVAPWAPEEQSRRPLVSSVVARMEDSERLDRKRPAEGSLLEENADVKKRNKRLFGAILGTLQRFSRDEEQAKSTAAAQRRAELERKAEEKKAEESRRLRQQARDEIRQIREGDVARKREISAQAACKRLEIVYATRLARADKLGTRFFLTRTGPPLYWCPGKSCTELEQLAERQRQEHVEWKAGQLDKLEQEKAQLMEQLTRPRWRDREHGGEPGQQGGGEAAAEGETDEDAELEEDAEMQDTAAGEEGQAEEAPDTQDQQHHQQEDEEEANGRGTAADSTLAEEAQ